MVVWRLDRLGRSAKELLAIGEDLHEHGIALRILTDRLAGSYSPSREGKFSSR
jgi:DNA invertase Pin-like site-specific DNA recombinase